MKKLFLTLMLTLCVVSFAEAGYERDDCEELGLKETTRSKYHRHCYKDENTDTTLDHAYGIGTDVELWRSENADSFLEAVHGEYRHDFNNGRVEGFLVARVNLWQKIKGFFGR